MRIPTAWPTLTVVAWLATAAAASAQQPEQGQKPALDSSPAWTGLTKQADIIAAREALMLAAEELMRPIDTYTVDPNQDPVEVGDAAETVAAMMLAVPHLFPPTTNLYDPDAEFPETIALPRIWQEFPAFYGLASAASAAATAVTEAKNADELRQLSLGLRASCDACHMLYLRPYEPSGVTEEDRDFDFDSVFKNQQ